MVPNSSHIESPQNERKKPATQSNKDAPTDPTDPRIVDGVEKILVPIIRPMLETNSVRKGFKITRRDEYMSIVQLNTPKWRPIPPDVSGIKHFIRKTLTRREYGQTRLTLLECELARVRI
jgi:hypothetical protein